MCGVVDGGRNITLLNVAIRKLDELVSVKWMACDFYEWDLFFILTF